MLQPYIESARLCDNCWEKKEAFLTLELPINFLYIDYHLGSAGPLYNY